LKIIYGYTTVARGRDPFVDLAGKTVEQLVDATEPGRYLVDIIPFCRYVYTKTRAVLTLQVQYLPDWCPGTGFKKTARRMTVQLRQCTNQPYEFVKQQMREKKHKTSFLSEAIENNGSDTKMDFINKNAALSLYLGGSDTTVSSLKTFFLAMTVFPEIQKKAQEELDRVIGSSRLPVSADRVDLPYIEAIMKETHRWHPIAPMGVPHSSMEEDVYNGYRIPKGAMMLPNIWWVYLGCYAAPANFLPRWFTHDPTVYPEPMVFRPERYIPTPTHAAEPDPRSYVFGYGRRICPGRYVADNSMFITIAQSLAVFKIEKQVKNGKTVEPEVCFEPGLISAPLPYCTSIMPRSEMHRELIQKVQEDYPWEESDAKELEGIKW
jgi:cytochrome P450